MPMSARSIDRECKKYREMDVWHASSLILDRSVIMYLIPKNASSQDCFDDTVDDIVEVLDHGKGILQHKPEALTCRVHCRVESKYIYFLPSIKQ